MDYENEINKTIQSISGTYSAYTVFKDWVEVYALAIQNTCERVNPLCNKKVWDEREERYLSVINKYSMDDRMKFSGMCDMLVKAFNENGIDDYLGNVYMKAGCGNKSTAQFFTPFNISVASASLGMPEIKNGKIKIHEPSCGGGGMVLAAAKVLLDKGENYQRVMEVVAQDLDWTSVHMAYVQLSLTGISAVVVQGDTLVDPYNIGYPDARVFRTPRKMGVIY